MKRNSYSYSFIPIYSYFMDYEPVKEIVDVEGSDGLGVVLSLLLHLLRYRGGIAKLTDLKTLAVPMRKRKAYLLHIVNDYRMFRLTPDGLSFYSPYLREVMKLVLEIMAEEDYYQSVNGLQTGQETGREKASKNNSKSIGKSFVNHLQTNNKSFTNDFGKSQSADNQAVSETHKYNMYNKDNKNNKNNNIKNNSSSTSNKKLSGESFSEEDEKSFLKKENIDEVTPAPVKSRRRRGQSAEEAQMTIEEKIERVFADKKWVTSLYKSHRLGFNPNLNQWGPFCMGVVKEWMINEVRVKCHGDKSVKDLQGYAYNLLRPESRTRHECDDYLDKQREKEAERREKEGFEYEKSEEEKIADEKWKKEYAEYEENFWRGVREAREREKSLKAAAERDRQRSEEQRLRGIPYHQPESTEEEEEEDFRPYLDEYGRLCAPEMADWDRIDRAKDEDWGPADKDGRRYYLHDDYMLGSKKEEKDIPYLEAGALYVPERFDWIKVDSCDDECWGPEDKDGRRYFIGDLNAVTL